MARITYGEWSLLRFTSKPLVPWALATCSNRKKALAAIIIFSPNTTSVCVRVGSGMASILLAVTAVAAAVTQPDPCRVVPASLTATLEGLGHIPGNGKTRQMKDRLEVANRSLPLHSCSVDYFEGFLEAITCKQWDVFSCEDLLFRAQPMFVFPPSLTHFPFSCTLDALTLYLPIPNRTFLIGFASCFVSTG